MIKTVVMLTEAEKETIYQSLDFILTPDMERYEFDIFDPRYLTGYVRESLLILNIITRLEFNLPLNLKEVTYVINSFDLCFTQAYNVLQEKIESITHKLRYFYSNSQHELRSYEQEFESFILNSNDKDFLIRFIYNNTKATMPLSKEDINKVHYCAKCSSNLMTFSKLIAHIRKIHNP